MNEERCSDLEKTKWRVLSHMIEGSVLPPREALNDVPGQRAIVALEIFLHEAFQCIKKEFLLKYVLPKSLEPAILDEERKLTRSGSKC